MHLTIDAVRKTFGDFVALEGVSLSVDETEFVCLLGPSGCGKTTLLRIIAGLLQQDSGKIVLDGVDLSGVLARDRRFGIVFQAYSLFPNMTVAENIGYGLKIRKEAADKIAKRVAHLLEMIRLPHVAQRFPYELSGGQQQRVALARAIAVEPALLLLDEPLSALDARVRTDLRDEIRDLQRRLGIPTIMVTHDQDEAMSLSDRIVCMNHGKIEQCGTPQELYLHPQTQFVAKFMGVSNLFNAAHFQGFRPDLAAAMPPPDDTHQLCVRPETIALKPGEDGLIKTVQFLGNVTRAKIETPLGDVITEHRGALAFNPGDRVALVFDKDALNWVRS